MNTLETVQKTKKIRNYLAWYVVLLLILGSFTIGLFAGRTQNVLHNYAKQQEIETGIINKYTDKSKKVDFNLFWQIWDLVEKKFIKKPLDYQKMLYGAISGMVAGLDDPYTVFMDPDVTKKFNEEIEGNFEGIGAEVGMKNNKITIISPLPGSPADRVGLRSRDVVVKINNEETQYMTLTEAVSKIRGKKGTEVILTISRKNEKDLKEFKIKREEIKTKSVILKELKTTKNQKIAYIELSYFGEETARDLKKAAQDILSKKYKGVILDLRNNGGGYLESSIDVISLFVKKDEIAAIQVSGDGNKKEYKTKGEALLSDLPLVILINEGSASASEIVAGALRDLRSAALIGEKSYGKGSVQEYEKFPDGSSIRISIAKWLTPRGTDINGEGIKPSIEIKITDEDYNQDKDPQIDRAKKEIEKIIK